MMDKLNLKEYWFLNSVVRYEKLFGPKAFSLDKNGNFRSKYVSHMVECGYMEVNENKQIVVSDVGKEYLISNKPY